MIALACDHGAFDLKQAIMKHLEARGLAYKDFGCYDKSSCDYPDFAAPAARAVASGECDRGIVVCTTGIGVSITANKIKGIRCALLSDVMSARLTRELQTDGKEYHAIITFDTQAFNAPDDPCDDPEKT